MLRSPFKQWIDQYLTFNRKDRNAIIILSSLILLVLAGHLAVDYIQLDSDIDKEKVKKALAEWNKLREAQSKKYSLFSFDPNTIASEKLDSLLIPDFIKRNIISYRDAGGKFQQPTDVRKIYGMNDSIFSKLEKFITIDRDSHSVPVFSRSNKSKTIQTEKIGKKREGFFDPNTAEQTLLLEYGLSAFQASNIIKYRENGGSFKQPADLMRIYGIDSLFFFSIKSNVLIQPTFGQDVLTESGVPVVRIELNSADSAALVKLRGIGPVFASRIIKFRHLLGGYHSREQLLEVYNFPAETYKNIEPQIYTDTLLVEKIRLNFTNFDELVQHPYLNKKHVSAILTYRDKNGAFNSVAQLNTEGILDVETYEKVKNYLSCR